MMNYFTGVFVVPSQGRKIKLNSSWKDFFGYDHFTDDEFREQFRVSRVSFLQLYEVIKHNPIFSSVKKRRSQTLIQLQLMIFCISYLLMALVESLKGLGSILRLVKKNARHYFKRVLMAVLSLCYEVASWPSEEEKKVYLVTSL
jgi:hypothetical protein